MRRILIAGGSGFLGKILEGHFTSIGDKVTLLSRNSGVCAITPDWVYWDGKSLGAWSEALDSADVLINLSGKSVDCRYTRKNKELICSSRLAATKILGEAITKSASPPALWINMSSATIYKHSLDAPNNEANGVVGSGFSVEVCKAWEKEFERWKTPYTRKVTLRCAIVLGNSGGVMVPLKNLVRVGLGGSQGNGKQYMSWLHQDDLSGIVQFIVDNNQLSGVFNTTSPFPLRNEEVMQVLRDAMNIRLGLPIPKWILEMGAVLIGTETELVLKSRWVVPQRLHDEGYRFQYDHIEEAFANLI